MTAVLLSVWTHCKLYERPRAMCCAVTILHVPGALRCWALLGITKTATAGREAENAVARLHPHTDFLRAQHALLTIGEQAVDVRLARLAAAQPIGRIDYPIASGVEERHLVAFVDHRERGAQTATPGAIATRVRAEFVVLDEEGKTLFGEFHTGAADTTRHVDLADVGPAVTALRRAATTTRVEEMPDELASSARIMTVHGKTQPA